MVAARKGLAGSVGTQDRPSATLLAALRGWTVALLPMVQT